MTEFGTIVLVPFPFTDLSSSKVKPALVVSKKHSGYDLILCFITSKHAPRQSCSMPIPANAKTGLKVLSAVCFDKIVTLERRLILGELGKIDGSLLKNHRKAFFSAFGFGQ